MHAEDCSLLFICLASRFYAGSKNYLSDFCVPRCLLPEPGLCSVLEDVCEVEVEATLWSELMLSWPRGELDFLGFLSVRCSGELFLGGGRGRRGLAVVLTFSQAWALYSTISP